MGVLAGILMSFFADIFTKTFFHATFKIAIALAFIAIFVGAIYLYVAGFSTIITALGQTMPQIVSGVWGWVMPSNTNTCLFYVFTSVLLRFTTINFMRVLDYKYAAAISN